MAFINSRRVFFFSILLLCYFFAGCGSKQKKQEVVEENCLPTINLSENISTVETLPLSEVVDKVEIILLETSNQSLFSRIEQVEVTSSDIWVQGIKENIIYRFSRSGQFLNKVGRVGQGPQEYIGLWSFQVDEPQEEIYCLTPSSGILVYDFHGKFKRKATSTGLNDMFTANNQQFKFFQGSFFLLQNLCTMPTLHNPTDSLWSVALTDTEFQVEKIFKNTTHIGREELLAENGGEFMGWKNYWREWPTVIDTYQDKLTLKYPDTDTIYCYDKANKSFRPQYAIHTIEPKGEYGDTHQRFRTRNAFNYFTLTDYFPTKDFIYLKGYKGEEIYTYAYHKESGAVKVVKQECKIGEYQVPYVGKTSYKFLADFPSAFWNDFCGCTFDIQKRSSGKYWIDIFESGSEKTEELIEALKVSANNEPQKQELLNKLEKIVNEDSNPLLVIAILK